jgi:hypothetical protein
MKILLSAIIAGIVAIWLAITFYQNQMANYAVNEASMSCDKAKFDLAFAKREKDTDAAKLALADVTNFCDKRDQKMAERDQKEIKTEAELGEMRESLRNEIYKK